MPHIGVEPVPKATRVRTSGTLQSASTTIPVPGGFTPDNLEVHIDGWRVQPEDYDDSDGLNLVFPEALPAGTDYEIIEARTFESADHYTKQEIRDAAWDFNNMPTVGGDPIVESDSNADGYFTRWAEGTVLQRSLVPVADNDNNGTVFNLPTALASLDGASIAGGGTGMNSSSLNASFVVETGFINTTSAKVKALTHTASTVLNSNTAVRATVAGRWK